MVRLRRVLGAALGAPVIALAVLGVEAALARQGMPLEGPPLALGGPVGEGPGAALDVTWLGDSTAAGLGASAAAAALPVVVAEGLDRPVELTVLADSGATTAEVVAHQLPAVAGFHPDVVFVSVGANDVTHLTSRSGFRRAYRRLLAGLPPGAEVVVLGVPDMGAIPRLAQPLRAVAGWRGERLDAVVRDLALASGAAYVDIAEETGPPFRADPERSFAADRYHPSDAGYRRWAEAVLEVVGSTTLGR